MIEISENIKHFAGVAERYCAWAEQPGDNPEDDMLVAQQLLAELHLAVIKLLDIGCGEDTTHSLSLDDWKVVLHRFQELPIDLYWDVFDPLEEEAPVLNSLSDDLADIYRDIKEGLILHRRELIVEAVWEWRFGFQFHWGAHLTGAQRAVHSYLSTK